MKKQIIVVLLLLYGFAQANAEPISGSLSVCVGQTTALSDAIPGGTWSSSDTSLATVNETTGVVSGISAGTATISYIAGETVDVATVSVNALPNTIIGDPLVCIGSNTILRSNLFGSWSSSDTSIATISPVYDNNHALGSVTGISTGTAVITYTRTNGCYTTHTIEVPGVLGSAITCDYDFYVCEGSDISLANATPGGTWLSSNDYIASVGSSSGVVHGGHLDLGPAREVSISYVTTDEVKQCAVHSFTVTPLVRVVYVNEVCVGNSITFIPDSLGGTWSTSNASILSINSSGLATGVSSGPAQVIYQLTNRPNCMNNRATSSPSIIVSEPPAITGATTVCIGQTSLLSTGVSGTWSSSTPSIGTIGSSTGLLGGISAGTTVITFTKSIACYTSAIATVNALPAAIAGTLNACPGATRTLSSATGGGTWSSSNTSVATIGSATGVVAAILPGTTTISYTAPTGCTTTAIFTVNALPLAAPSYEAMVCTTGTLRLYANSTDAATYLWAGPSGFSSTLQNPTRASATTAMAGTYTLTVTSAAGCSAAYTLSVSVLTSAPFSVSVTQISPFTLTGETRHTWGSGFTLRADPSVTLPAGATYTWTGPVNGAASTFAPSFTTSTVVTFKYYTVAATYNGCRATVKDTIVVPATGCSPYNYFSVNNYRSSIGLAALSGCSDCNTVQPFYTINGTSLDATNVVDGANYYITNTNYVMCNKDTFKNNNFYMAYLTKLVVDTGNSVTIDSCHFNSQCGWVGIIVRQGVSSVAHLKVINNTLIEGAIGSTFEGIFWGGIIAWPTPGGGGYYDAGMADIIESNGAIYNKDGSGIGIYGYKPSMADLPAGSRLPYTIKNSVFSRVEFARNDAGSTSAASYPFSWPTVAALKTVTTPGAVPKFGLNSYRVVGSILNLGVIFSGVGNKTQLTSGDASTPATYEYNYIDLGINSDDPDYDSTNLFDSLNMGVSILNSNVRLYNNTFRNITNMAVSASYTYNDLRVEGDTAAHTNNRFYNCNTGIRLHGGTPDPWDFTCSNTLFKSVMGITGMVTSVNSCYLALTNGHGKHQFVNNMIKNYDVGVLATNHGSASLKGYTRIYGNTFEGRTSFPSTDAMRIAVYMTDGQNSTYGNGDIFVDSNYITGAALGIHGEAVARRLYVYNNRIVALPYVSPQGNIIAGVYMATCPGVKEVKYNYVSGQGYNCIGTGSIPLIGYKFSSTGTATNISDISCNLAADINYGFSYGGTSRVLMHHNEMCRNACGIMFDPASSIGQQGALCDPIDNIWTDHGTPYNVCGTTFPGWLTTSVSATHTSNANPALSKMYVRNLVGFKPYNNTNNGGQTAFSYGATLLYAEDATLCPTLATTVTCAPSPAERGAAEEEDNTLTAITTGNMRVFPNPSRDAVTIEVSDVNNTDAQVRVVNAVGTEVYRAMHTFSANQITLQLQNLPTGMYVVHLQLASGVINTGRIIIVK